MKILHISTGDLNGGAFRGAYWLHRSLIDLGVESLLLVKNKFGDDSSVIQIPKSAMLQKIEKVKNIINTVPLSFYKKRSKALFSPAFTSSFELVKVINELEPDIINLHWVNDGFLSPEIIRKFSAPVVWTIRDMWTFTGGCHYSGECDSYINKCGSCCALGSKNKNDISRQVWIRKRRSWQSVNFQVVAISNWLAECAEKSSLLGSSNIRVIHNAVDENVFKPTSKHHAREILNLPQDIKLISFGAINATANPLKGFDYLSNALRKLSRSVARSHFHVVIFGSSEPEIPIELGFETTYLGRLYDDITLALVYSAVDLMVVPSIQEGFGKTAIEAMSCGTPVVSFDTTGLKDIVEHKQSGYRAKCFDTEDLANGIKWVLEKEDRYERLSILSRQRVEEKFTLNKQAKEYMNFYEQLLIRNGSK